MDMSTGHRSKGHMLRAMVNQRLSEAAEEIFALFERTILEYEEELCRSIEDNRRKQRLLDTFLSPTSLPHTGAPRVQAPSPSPPGPRVNPEVLPETAQIKKETEELDVKQEEEQLQQMYDSTSVEIGVLTRPVSEFSAVCVKTEESSLLQQEQTEHKEKAHGENSSSEPHFHSETEGHTEHSSDTDHEDWGAPFNCPATQMETETEGDVYNQVQLRDTSTSTQFSGPSVEYRSAPETSAAVANGDVSDAVHGAERKKHQCFVCQKRFDSKILLQIHIRVHTGEKPYSCPVCKKAFAQKNNLNAHTIIHTGEKPYSCTLCNKTFGRKCTLKRHMKIHAAEKPSACDKAFTVKCVQTYMRTPTYL